MIFREKFLQISVLFASALTENGPVSGASLKKAEIFYGYFEIFVHSK